jgi:hypothetical protein
MKAFQSEKEKHKNTNSSTHKGEESKTSTETSSGGTKLSTLTAMKKLTSNGTSHRGNKTS